MAECQCGKIIYVSRGDAERAKKRIEGKGGSKQKVYPCPYNRKIYHLEKKDRKWWKN